MKPLSSRICLFQDSPESWAEQSFLRKDEKQEITFNNGCLGSRNDEERSETRYVMWIARQRESSNFWTHIALPLVGSTFVWASFDPFASAPCVCRRDSWAVEGFFWDSVTPLIAWKTESGCGVFLLKDHSPHILTFDSWRRTTKNSHGRLRSSSPLMPFTVQLGTWTVPVTIRSVSTAWLKNYRGRSECSDVFSLPNTKQVCQKKQPLSMTSDQARLPAEFKHINKRRKRN